MNVLKKLQDTYDNRIKCWYCNHHQYLFTKSRSVDDQYHITCSEFLGGCNKMIHALLTRQTTTTDDYIYGMSYAGNYYRYFLLSNRTAIWVYPENGKVKDVKKIVFDGFVSIEKFNKLKLFV